MPGVFIINGDRGDREALAALFQHASFDIAGSASGPGALNDLKASGATVVVIGHRPPTLDALAMTREIMEAAPVPIVVIADAGGSAGELASTFEAMEAGALAVVPRPRDARTADELVRTTRLMAEVRVVRRWNRAARAPSRPAAACPVRVVAVGASTGGPIALASLLQGLRDDFPTPLLVVQHMAPGFARGFADWLAPASRLPVHIATDGERLLPGHVYLAPDGVQMGASVGGSVKLVHAPPENNLRPSVSFLFRSVAELYGAAAAGILLTGMGRDGAAELKSMRDRGAVTFAQDCESSIVHGMPGEAIRLGAARHVLPPEQIARTLNHLVEKTR